MVCPNCRAAGAVVTFCRGCGATVPAAASGQFGTPVQSGCAPTPTYPAGYLAAAKPVGNTYSIIGIVLGVVALVVAPLILGLVGASLAQRAHNRGECLWKTSLSVSLTGLVLGLVINGLLLAFRVDLF